MTMKNTCIEITSTINLAIIGVVGIQTVHDVNDRFVVKDIIVIRKVNPTTKIGILQCSKTSTPTMQLV